MTVRISACRAGLLVLLVMLAAGVGCADDPLVDDAAPDFSLQDLSGETVSLSDFAGQVVILNFWATWCPPCREEIPDFIELTRHYRDREVTILGVSLDEGPRSTVKDFAEQMGINYQIVMADREILAAYGPFRFVPTTFVIDRDGRVASKHIGARTKAVFEGEIRSLLGDGG